jgi:cadmium resistance protein CadD (predicted permease)
MMLLLGLAVAAFFSTNIDGLFILLILFGDRRFRARDIVAGEYIGTAALYALSVVCSLTSLVIPRADIGLLGLVPVGIGAGKLYSLWHDRAKTEETLSPRYNAGSHGRVLPVAAVIIANGGDNIGIYIPLFAIRSGFDIAVIGLVFAVMTALWCLIAYWLVKHPALGPPLNRYGHWVVPFVLIGLGLLILLEEGSFELLAKI